MNKKNIEKSRNGVFPPTHKFLLASIYITALTGNELGSLHRDVSKLEGSKKLLVYLRLVEKTGRVIPM